MLIVFFLIFLIIIKVFFLNLFLLDLIFWIERKVVFWRKNDNELEVLKMI